MSDAKKITDEVTVGGQPAKDDLAQIAKDGFKTVINFREDGEENQPMRPTEEQKLVESLGMTYLSLPVSMNDLGPETVDNFREKFKQLPKPAYAHCASGKRAGAMVLMNMACEAKWSGEETLEKAHSMGFECDQPQLREFVVEYVNSQR